MKKSLMLLFFSFSVLFTSCKKDDTTTAPPTTTTDPIVGVWVSDGANVAYGLQYWFKIKKVVVTFNENKTYTVIQTDSSNVTTTLTGTYKNTVSTYTDTLSTSITKGATIYEIEAKQDKPTTITAVGIYAISSTNMSYEVDQTEPSIGVTPPTPQTGFGSTMAGGIKYPIYIQKYVKQ